MPKMIKTVKSILITQLLKNNYLSSYCDFDYRATMVFLMTLKDNFIISEIDDTSLFIEESRLEWVKEKVADFKNKYSYEKLAGLIP